MNLLKIILGLTVAISCTGYAKTNYDEPQPLEFKVDGKLDLYKNKNKKKNKKQNKAYLDAISACEFNVSPVNDARQNKETIGHNFAYPLLIKGFDTFLSQVHSDLVLARLNKFEKGESKITLKPQLTRLYSYAENMNINAIAALKVDVYADNNKIETRHFRALNSDSNWNNGVGEYHSSANDAVNKVIKELFLSFPELCKQAVTQ